MVVVNEKTSSGELLELGRTDNVEESMQTTVGVAFHPRLKYNVPLTRIDLFLRISRLRENGGSVPICNTEIVKEHLHPTWKRVLISKQQFGSKDNPLTIGILGFNRNGHHELIGKVDTTLADLEMLYKEKIGVDFIIPSSHHGREKVSEGQLFVDQFWEKEQFSFLGDEFGGVETEAPKKCVFRLRQIGDWPGCSSDVRGRARQRSTNSDGDVNCTDFFDPSPTVYPPAPQFQRMESIAIMSPAEVQDQAVLSTRCNLDVRHLAPPLINTLLHFLTSMGYSIELWVRSVENDDSQNNGNDDQLFMNIFFSGVVMLPILFTSFKIPLIMAIRNNSPDLLWPAILESGRFLGFFFHSADDLDGFTITSLLDYRSPGCNTTLGAWSAVFITRCDVCRLSFSVAPPPRTLVLELNWLTTKSSVPHKLKVPSYQVLFRVCQSFIH